MTIEKINEVSSKFFRLLPSCYEVPDTCELGDTGYMRIAWKSGVEVRVYPDGLLGIGDQEDRYYLDGHIPLSILARVPKVE